MQETNNSQESVVSEYVPLRADVKILAAVVVLVCLALYFVTTFSQRIDTQAPFVAVAPVDQTSPIVSSPDGAARTDLQGVIPAQLALYVSSSTPEQVNQTYTLKYPEGEQSTVVYEMVGTTEENKEQIAIWLQTDGWIVMSSSSLPSVSSFYAMKKTSEMNITIAPIDNAESSQITVSIFNRP